MDEAVDHGRGDEGNRVAYPAAFEPSESVLTQLVDARRYPELVDVRETLRRMRFHHQLRTDDEAPARQSSLGTGTFAVADDGADLAAALATIQHKGDAQSLEACIADAFDDALLDIREDDSGRLDLALLRSLDHASLDSAGVVRRAVALSLSRRRLAVTSATDRRRPK